MNIRKTKQDSMNGHLPISNVDCLLKFQRSGRKDIGQRGNCERNTSKIRYIGEFVKR